MSKTTIATYRLESILRHYKTIVSRATIPPSDTKASNARRLALKEIVWLRNEIERQKKNKAVSSGDDSYNLQTPQKL